jgi:GWxTD domain-containing protein
MNKTGWIILLGVLFVTGGYAQFYESSNQSGAGIPYFELELYRTFADDRHSTRLYIYTEILYDDLTFVKDTNSPFYRARLELQLVLVNKEEQQIGSESLNRNISETDFEITNSRDRSVQLNHYFDIPYGEYILKIRMNDEMSRKTTTGKIELILNDYRSETLALSDLLMLNELALDSTGQIIKSIPRVKNNFPKKEGSFYFQFDIFSSLIPRDVSVNLKLLDEKENVELDSTIFQELVDTVTTLYFKITKNQLKKNNFTCVVQAEGDHEKVESSKRVSFYWVDMPSSSEDISLALNQMRYILPGDSLDRYIEAPLEQQQRFFASYWAQRDPNPNTKVNELMEEYFSRINYAEREFSNFSSRGWLSDRGRILIKFGHPDDIERHPFELNTQPFEIWRYYTLRRVFVFSDESGFGDYRLLPQYMNQEY